MELILKRPYIIHSKPFDRFIPYRPFLNAEVSNYRLQTEDVSDVREVGQYRDSNPTSMAKLLNGGKLPSEGRVLPLIGSPKPKADPFDGTEFNLLTSSTQSRKRQIPKSPECVMDMPGMRDDYYTNLLDWGHQNIIAVALQKSTYVWHAESKECQRIGFFFSEAEDTHTDFFITAISWKPSEYVLAVADTEGKITVCDVDARKIQRKFTRVGGKRCYIGSLLWTGGTLVCGSRRGRITLLDQRQHEHQGVVASLLGHHRQEVCGLTYRAPYLASGGEDGLVNIWDMRMNGNINSIHAHEACAKAISWCPWRRGVIASGGGSNDGCIRIWNSNNGEMIRETFTNSQVCALLWSNEYSELVSSHGSAVPKNNEIVVWNMKKLEFEPLALLRQHVARPLHLCLSPDETTVASAGADESLCLWKLFPKKKKKEKTLWESSPLNMWRSIR